MITDFHHCMITFVIVCLQHRRVDLLQLMLDAEEDAGMIQDLDLSSRFTACGRKNGHKNGLTNGYKRLNHSNSGSRTGSESSSDGDDVTNGHVANGNGVKNGYNGRAIKRRALSKKVKLF